MAFNLYVADQIIYSRSISRQINVSVQRLFHGHPSGSPILYYDTQEVSTFNSLSHVGLVQYEEFIATAGAGVTRKKSKIVP